MCVVRLVGGIYTVIRTKAPVTTAESGEQFCMIGPYNEKFIHLEVEPTEPDLSITREVLAQMRSHNIKCAIVCVINLELFKLLHDNASCHLVSLGALSTVNM